jgi:hypothetical protein
MRIERGEERTPPGHYGHFVRVPAAGHLGTAEELCEHDAAVRPDVAPELITWHELMNRHRIAICPECGAEV